MSQVDFETYLVKAVQDYAKDKVEAGNWQASEALHESEQAFRKLLPDGVDTKNHYLFSILSAGQKVGMIWFAVDERSARPTAFIYDFSVDEAFRRQGLGKQALLAVEDEVKALDIDTLSLHVFGHNTAARRLYEQLGYSITNVNMSKKLR